MEGWIKIHRSLLDKGWFRKPEAVQLWLYLLLKAEFQDTESFWLGKVVYLKAGQFITGRRKISNDTGISESSVERLLNMFEMCSQIEQQKSNTSRLISILNYEKFQASEQRMNNKRTANGQQMDTIIRNKEILLSKDNNIIIGGSSEIEILKHEVIEFQNKNCPSVSKLKKQMTNEDAEKLVGEFGVESVKEILLDMENWKNIKTKTNVYLTARKWLQNNKNRNNGNATRNTNGTQKISFDDAIRDWVTNG